MIAQIDGSLTWSADMTGQNDLDVVAVVLREQRAQRAIRETRGQNRVLGWPTFALDEAAGDLARGVHLLFVLDLEREEVDSFARLLGCDDGGQDDGLAVAHHDRAVGEAATRPCSMDKVRPPISVSNFVMGIVLLQLPMRKHGKGGSLAAFWNDVNA